MRKALNGLLLALAVVGFNFVAGVAQAQNGQLLLQFDYYVRANRPYATGAYQVYGAPVRTSTVTVKQRGSSYCDLRIDRVVYYTENPGYPREARSLGRGTYEIPEGVVYSLDIDFTQIYWDGVDCTLLAYAGNGGGGGGSSDEQLLGALNFEGGFQRDMTIAVNPARAIKRFRFAVPSFCTGVEIPEAGTVVDGIFYRAQKSGTGTFSLPSSAGTYPVVSIKAALNGPTGSRCSIPVYFTEAVLGR